MWHGAVNWRVPINALAGNVHDHASHGLLSAAGSGFFRNGPGYSPSGDVDRLLAGEWARPQI